MPNALLRDFTSYTLVVEPSLATAEDYVAAYRDTVDEIYAPLRRLGKLAHDVPALVRAGGGPGRNWEPLFRANGVTPGHCGVWAGAKAGGVGRQSPGAVPGV